MVEKVRTRFAPSPTGFLHVGGVRTALFAWLLAKKNDGQFILRIEDTDKAREVAGSEQHIMDSLHWLGIEWSEGPDKPAGSGPYRQSERLDTYREWGQKLIEADRAYADTYSVEQLDELRQKAKAEKRPFLFREHRPDNPPPWDGKTPLRFKSDPKAYKWDDEVMGKLSTGPEAVDDFILIKSDGYPTYNFAHIIDDHLMDITHVIRSQEFLASVPKFLNLYEALDIKRPKLATLPYVMNPDGRKKLSKRDGAKDILDYKNEGYLHEALISFLATLGWNDGTTQEVYTTQELIQKFSLNRVHKAGARFDEQRLLWVNGHFIRHLSAEEFSNQAEAFWPEQASSAAHEYKKAILEIVQDRIKFMAELPQLTDFFFEDPDPAEVSRLYADPVDKQLIKLDDREAIYRRLLTTALHGLQSSDFTQDNLKEVLNSLLKSLDTTPSVLFPVIRIAASGKEFSPELSGTLRVLGKERVVGRLKKALSALEK